MKISTSAIKPFFFSILLSITLSATAQVRYVTPQGAGTKDGSSWANAFGNAEFTTALANAPKGTSFWIKAGNYLPGRDLFFNTPGNPRSATFRIRDSLFIYGGFAGNETALQQRNPAVYKTLFNGDIGVINVTNDNAYQVVTMVNAPYAVVDGLHIENGNADGTAIDNVDGTLVPHKQGGGVFMIFGGKTINCVVKNCRGEYGAGICATENGEIWDCTVSNCTTGTSGGAGGGINVSERAAAFNCSVSFCISGMGAGFFVNNARVERSQANNNQATSTGGGFAVFGNSKVSNSLVTHNSATSGGGIYSSFYGDIINCTITGNVSTIWGAGIWMVGGASVSNCIIWGNMIGGSPGDALFNDQPPVLKRNIIGSGWPVDGEGIYTNTDPLFQDAALGNYRLKQSSPAINQGDNSVVNGSLDLDKLLRVAFDIVDVGAYERQLPGSATYSRLYVNAAATGNNTGINWPNAMLSLGQALRYAYYDDNIREIWVAKGTYYPTIAASFDPGLFDQREWTFRIPDSVKVYGGFLGVEALLSERNILANQTILSGDIGIPGDSLDNAYHVVTMTGNYESVLSGFGIEKGNANSINTISADGIVISHMRGGGIFAKNAGLIEDCVVQKNSTSHAGGGIYIGDSGIVRRNLVIDNNAQDYGGGIFLDGGGSVFESAIVRNRSGAFGGSGIYCNNGDTVRNCLISQNNNRGINVVDKGHFINCTITGNASGTNAAGMYAIGTGHSLVNCIVYGNIPVNPSPDYDTTVMAKTVFNYLSKNLVGNVFNTDAEKIISKDDPLFVDPAANNFQLSKCSPAVNKGNTSYAQSTSTDLGQNPRIFGSVVDLGAYELQEAAGTAPASPVLTVGGPALFCDGDSVQINSSVSNNNQWYRNNQLIAGATTQSYRAKIAGSYTARVNIGGCISAVSAPVSVNVIPAPPKPTITANGSVLSSSAANNNQWYLNGTIIPGAISATYTAQSTGIYAVVVTVNGCSSRSDDFNFTTTGLPGPGNWNNEVIVFPNPVHDKVFVRNTQSRRLLVEIVDVMGKRLHNSSFSNSSHTIDMSAYSAGIYLIKITDISKKQSIMTKVVKQ